MTTRKRLAFAGLARRLFQIISPSCDRRDPMIFSQRSKEIARV